MNVEAESGQRLLVILDPDFGDRLRDAWHGQPVWVVMSVGNEPVVRSLWASRADQDHLTGITGFSFDGTIAAEDRFLDELDMIDLHHGPYSTKSPYTILDVMGVRLRGDIRDALSELGFTDFAENTEGFSAERSSAEANRLKE